MSNTMKKLLVVNYNNAGVGKYRLLDPHIELSRISKDIEVHFGEDGDLAMLAQGKTSFDYLFIHSSVAPDVNRMNMIKTIQKNGVKLIVDIDDYWFLDSRSQISRTTRRENFHLKITNLLKMADLVTTTTKSLANEIKAFQKNIAILPNCVNPNEPQFKSKKTESERVRIGFLGGSSHLDDIRMLRMGINRILTEFPDQAQFVLCGFNDTIRDIMSGKVVKNAQKSVWSEYEKIFTANFSRISPEYKKYLLRYTKDEYPNLKDESYRRIWTKPISTYASGYNHLDISLSPLVDNKFNIMKSQLKVIEAGFHKTPIIASNVIPYQIDLKQGENAFLVNEAKAKKDWYKYMKVLINNKELRDEMGQALYETVKDTYNLTNVTQLRNEIYMTL